MGHHHSDFNRHTHKINTLAKTLKGPCVEGALGKCWCGATIKTLLDAQLHNHAPRKAPDNVHEEEMTVGELRVL
jgi:hypothetical protein